AWASFPCQDLSLAGGRAGLDGERSGTFWAFWRIIQCLAAEGKAPRAIVLENVCGVLTSNGGKDFMGICDTLNEGGYRIGALVIDSVDFLPHSRPRLFFVAVRKTEPLPRSLVREAPHGKWHTRPLIRAFERLPEQLKRSWVWWSMPSPEGGRNELIDLIEANPPTNLWHSAEVTRGLLEMMSPGNRAKVATVQEAGSNAIGCVYRRTRQENGAKVQRAEVRFDGVAGCLRTPSGGSSRQILIIVESREISSRLISPRETARLMGLPDTYTLPESYSDAYHLSGDGVAVPVVRHLAQSILEPLLTPND
ncbi:MAG: DNA (cytosine-5-)-methyltransferase, partial [Verrucomicrobiaceae bacterium]